MSDPIVGIDLGTSNTVVAHADGTNPAQVLADGNGFKIHPSVVSFHPSGGVVVGAAAKQRKVIDPKNTIYSVKRLIGRSFNSKEVQTAKQRMPYQIKEGANQLPLIVTRGGEFAVPEISAIVLDHAKNVATTALKTDVSRAVVTVPASFNDAQRSATATAGSIAGLTVVRVLNEPTAAALAYGHTRNLRETIAVYDFGGGTFDITILKLEDQVYEVLGTAGDSFLGGDDLDERIVDRMVDKFLAENRVDLRTNEVSMMRLRAVAEQTKIELSRRSRAVVRVDEIAYGAKGKPLDLQIEIRRDEFVSQVSDIIDRTFPVCEESLKLAGLTIDHIDDVILVGGTTKIPYVRDQVQKFFAKAPRTDVNPEDAVAVGAALQATALERILTRKSPSRAPVPEGQFTTDESTFGGDSNYTETGTYDPSKTIPGGRADSTMPSMSTLVDPETDALLDALEQTSESPPIKQQPQKRTTAGYSDAKPPAGSSRAPDRPVERGRHHDVFQEKPATPPPSTPVIGRMTKSGLKPPPGGIAKTQMGLPTVSPPPAPKTTAPNMPAPRPPAVPAAGPPPGSPAAGPPPGSPAAGPQSRTMVAQQDDDDFGFTNLETEKGYIDLDLEPSSTMKELDLSPASTAKGFSPPVQVPPSQQPTQVAQVPQPQVASQQRTQVAQVPQPLVASPQQRTQVAQVPPQFPTQGASPPPQFPTQGASTPPQFPTQAASPPPQFPTEGAPISQQRTQVVAPAQQPTQVASIPQQFPTLAASVPQQFPTLAASVPQQVPTHGTPISQQPTQMVTPGSQQPTQVAGSMSFGGPMMAAPTFDAPSTSPRPAPMPPPHGAPAPMPATYPVKPNPVVLDVTPRGLGIGTVAGFCEELIRRNSRVPTETRKLFSTSRDDQDAVRIIVVQGESRRMDNNTVIADLRLDNLPRRPRGETSIEVTFMLDANGILQVRARDAHTGREQRASLDIIGSIPQEDVSASREKLAALRR